MREMIYITPEFRLCLQSIITDHSFPKILQKYLMKHKCLKFLSYFQKITVTQSVSLFTVVK